MAFIDQHQYVGAVIEAGGLFNRRTEFVDDRKDDAFIALANLLGQSLASSGHGFFLAFLGDSTPGDKVSG